MKNLLDYIKGDRRGKFAHDIEKAAMQDPFLEDALEGYDLVEEDHHNSIKQLQNQIFEKTEKRKSYISNFYIAASIVILFSISVYFLLYDSKKEANNIAYQPIQKNDVTQTIVPEKRENTILRKEKIVEKENKKIEQRNSFIAKNEDQIKADKEYIKQNADTQSIAFEDNSKYLERPLSAEGIKQKDITITTSPYLARNYQKNDINEQLQRDSSILYKNDNIIIGPQQEEKKLLASKILINKKNKNRYNKESVSDSINILSADQSDYDASPVIGIESYNRYLKDHTPLLKEGKCYQARGNLLIDFSISESGRPYNIKIIKSLCPELDIKVIELIRNGADWKGTKGKIQFYR